MDRRYMRAGILVVGDVTAHGCTSYRHSDHLERPRDNGGLEAEWTIQRFVKDPEEQKATNARRESLMNRVRRLGAPLRSIGWLVPEEREVELQITLAEIRDEVEEFNAGAQYCSLQCNLLVFPVATDNEPVARALYGTAEDLLTRLAGAMASGDLRGFRRVLRDLQGVAAVLPLVQSQQVSVFLTEAQERARAAAKAMKAAAAGDKESVARAHLDGLAVEGARAAFLEAAPERDTSMELQAAVARELE